MPCSGTAVLLQLYSGVCAGLWCRWIVQQCVQYCRCISGEVQLSCSSSRTIKQLASAFAAVQTTSAVTCHASIKS